MGGEDNEGGDIGIMMYMQKKRQFCIDHNIHMKSHLKGEIPEATDRLVLLK